MSTATTPDVSLDDLAKKLSMYLPPDDPAASRLVGLSEDGQEPVTSDGVEEDEDDELDADKRNPEKNRMRVSFATSGIAKAALVWGGSLLLVGLVVSFYSGIAGKVGRSPELEEPLQAEAEEKPPEDERLAGLQRSESQARAELAMQRQQEQLVQINSADPKDQAAATARSQSGDTDPADNRTATATPQSAPAARPVPPPQPARQSRAVDRSPPPPRPVPVVRSAPPPVIRSAPLPAAARLPVRTAAPPVDPQQEWQRLAGLGTYGSVASSPIALGTSRSAPIPRAAATRPASASVATAASPSSSATHSTAPATAVPAVERSTAPPLAQYVRAQSTLPETTVQSSAQLRSLPEASPRRTVLVGSSVDAEVVSTIVWSAQTQSSPRFLIRLVEPLLDRDNQSILPANSLLVVSPRPLADESGLADLEVVSVVTEEAEYAPPAGAIVIRGADGDALIAQGERQGDTFGRDAAVIVSSMISEVGGLLNRPITQTQTSISTGAGTSITSSSTTPPPNYLGAALESGFGALSDILTERNEAAISEVMSAPEVFQIPGGTKVQVFVNRTMTF